MSVIRTLPRVRRPRIAGPGRGGWVGLLVAVAAAGILAGATPPAGAQERPTSLTQLRLDLTRVAAEYDAALAAANAQRNQLIEVLNEIPSSRASDVRAWEEGRTRFLEAAVELDRLEIRVEEKGRALDSVRGLVAERLVQRRDSLQQELALLPPGQGADLRALVRDLDFEIQELRPPPEEPSVAFAFRAPVAYDPRDGPVTIRGKIQQLERLLAEQDSSIAYWEGQVDQLEGRLRAERRLGDFQDGVGRFGDTRPPIIGNPTRDDDQPANLPPDSAAVQQQPPTLEELIESYRSALNNTRRYRDAIAENLVELRVVLGRIGER